MARLAQVFNGLMYDPEQMAGSLPIGKHKVVISDSEIKETKGGDGGFIQFTLEIIDGEHKGQTGPYRINLYNKNQQAVAIANKQLAALCYVTGVFQVNATEQLHGIPFTVEVDLQKGEEAKEKGYTEIKKVFDINGFEPWKQQRQPQPQQWQPQQQPATSQQWPPQSQPQQTWQQPQQEESVPQPPQQPDLPPWMQNR